MTENTAPISTRVPLLVLKNIKNNDKLDQKLPNAIKANRAGGKHKMESINCHIPKKPKKVH